jgi:hypothetical protein
MELMVQAKNKLQVTNKYGEVKYFPAVGQYTGEYGFWQFVFYRYKRQRSHER